jgi:cytochrome b561
LSRLPPFRYSRLQIQLHWLVVLLVIVQYATSGSIARTHTVSMSGLAPSQSDLFWHIIHNRCGLLIFALMALRVLVRIWRGVPQPVTGVPLNQYKAASTVHHLLYATLMLQAFTGAVATYLWWPISIVHRNLFYVFVVLAALHILAAFWHHFIKKDDTLRRIVKMTGN